MYNNALLAQQTFCLYVIFLCGKKCVKILWLCVPRALFSGKTQMQFPLYPCHWGLGLCCSLLKDKRFHKLTPFSDYYPEYNLCCDHLVVPIVHMLIYHGG